MEGFVSRALLFIGCLLFAFEANAVKVQVTSQTFGDGYQLVTADDGLLNRRRMHQYLRLAAFDLTSDGSYKLNLVTLMRFDTDLGLKQSELDRVSGLKQHQFSLQTAYLEGRNYFGFFSFKLGRILHWDALDFMMMDGASVRFKTPWYFAVELLGGLESRNFTNPITSSQFELDGVRVFDSDTDDRPSFIVGASIMTADLLFTKVKLAYRRMFSGGTMMDDATGQMIETGMKIDQEKVGIAAFQNIFKKLMFSGVLSYDLYNARVDRGIAKLRWIITPAWDLDVQYVHLIPTFDADSIFNIFSIHPLNDLNTRVRFHLSKRSRIYAGGMVRFFGNEPPDLANDDPVDTSVKAFGAMAGYYHSWGHKGRLSVDFSYEGGFGGTRILGDVMGMWAPLPQKFQIDGRVTAVYFDEDLLPNLNALSFGYQLGVKYFIKKLAAISLMAEHNFSRIHKQQFRLLAIVDFNVWVGK